MAPVTLEEWDALGHGTAHSNSYQASCPIDFSDSVQPSPLTQAHSTPDAPQLAKQSLPKPCHTWPIHTTGARTRSKTLRVRPQSCRSTRRPGPFSSAAVGVRAGRTRSSSGTTHSGARPRSSSSGRTSAGWHVAGPGSRSPSAAELSSSATRWPSSIWESGTPWDTSGSGFKREPCMDTYGGHRRTIVAVNPRGESYAGCVWPLQAWIFYGQHPFSAQGPSLSRQTINKYIASRNFTAIQNPSIPLHHHAQANEIDARNDYGHTAHLCRFRSVGLHPMQPRKTVSHPEDKYR